jgi:hypothetical protein
MKEETENIGSFEYNIEYTIDRTMFPHLFDETYSDDEVKLLFEKIFFKEVIKSERSKIGGNGGAHNINR